MNEPALSGHDIALQAANAVTFTEFKQACAPLAIGIAAHNEAKWAAVDRFEPLVDQPRRLICSSVTTRSTFSVLLLMR